MVYYDSHQILLFLVCDESSILVKRRIVIVVHCYRLFKTIVTMKLTRARRRVTLLIPAKERERVSGKVSNQRFVSSCLANSLSVYIYTVIRTLKLHLRLTSVFRSITFKTIAPQNAIINT